MRAMTRRRRALVAASQSPRHIDSLLLPRAVPTGVLSDQAHTISVNFSFETILNYSTVCYAKGTPADRLNQLGVSAGSSRNSLYIWYANGYVAVATKRNIYENTNYAITLSYHADSISLDINGASSSFVGTAQYNGGEIHIGDEQSEIGGAFVFRDAQIKKGNTVVYSAYPVELNGKYGIYDEISGSYVWF